MLSFILYFMDASFCDIGKLVKLCSVRMLCGHQEISYAFLLQEVDVQGKRGFCLKQVSDKQIIKCKNTELFI